MISLIPYAQAATNVAAQNAAKDFVAKINDAILFPLITLMMAIAFLVFLYGAFEYVRNATSESGRETGRQHLFYGVIGMLVMLSAMTILSITAGTFGLSEELSDAADTSSPFAPTSSLIPPRRPAGLGPAAEAPPSVMEDVGGNFGSTGAVDAAPAILESSETTLTFGARPIQPLTPEEEQMYEAYVTPYTLENTDGVTAAEASTIEQIIMDIYQPLGASEVIFVVDQPSLYTTSNVGADSQQEALCNKKGGQIVIESAYEGTISRTVMACLR